MPHVHRFFVPELEETVVISLPPEEAHHALRVVRVREGDEVTLFNGKGRESLARVSHCSKRDVALSIVTTRETERPKPALTLAVAWLHNDKAHDFIVRHGTELGVSKFCFFRAARSERPPKFSPKWEKLAIEACKQCGQLWLPEFVIAEGVQELLEQLGGTTLVAALDTAPTPLSACVTGEDTNLIIGPEGDFTAEELGVLLQHGARPISLGSAVFRTEVAAIIGAALVQYELGGLGP